MNDSLILTADVVRKLTQLRNAEYIQANCFEVETPIIAEPSADINSISNTLQQVTETNPINDCFSGAENNMIDYDDSVDGDILNGETVDF